jgi:multiple sugar transport system permease protein
VTARSDTLVDATRTPARRGRRPPIRTRTLVLHGSLIVFTFAMVFPFIWMVLTSFKSLGQILRDPLALWPNPWMVDNYANAWNSLPFAGAYWNSAYICALVVAGTLITAGMAGYAFARLEFPFSRVLFILFLATQMVPPQVTIVPLYVLLSRMGWIDTHLALIVPAALSNPFAVFLVRQFVRTLPVELEEAAMIDGAGRGRIFFSIVLPNLGAALSALGILVALNTWNSFFYPLVLLNSTDKFTLPLLLAQFQGQYGGMNYALVMAASVISVVPMLIVFVIGQRRIIASMAQSGLGGR